MFFENYLVCLTPTLDFILLAELIAAAVVVNLEHKVALDFQSWFKDTDDHYCSHTKRHEYFGDPGIDCTVRILSCYG